MIVIVDAKAFRDAVAWAARGVPGKPELPEYGGLRLVADDIDLTLTAFDGYATTETSIAAEVQTAGRVAASGRLLATLVATLPTQEPIVVSADSRTLTLTSGTVVVTLPLMSAVTQRSVVPAPAAVVDTEALADAVKRVAPIASRQGFADDFTQIRLNFTDDRFEAMAMDGRRAACAFGAATVERLDTTVTVNARTLVEIVGTFGTPEITIGADEHSASFTGGRRTLVARQWGKQYRLDVVRLALSWNPDAFALVPTKPLAEALKRAALTRTESEATALEWSEGSLVVRARGASQATVGDTLPVEYDGPPSRILVNPLLLGDALACTGGERTRIAFEPTNPIRPLRITDPDDDDYVHVMVPVRDMSAPALPFGRR
jgi:DNA polymerase-3 subunit beta